MEDFAEVLNWLYIKREREDVHDLQSDLGGIRNHPDYPMDSLSLDMFHSLLYKKN